MSFHIILNALIILFVLHIFLSNIQIHHIIGTPKSSTEHFGRQLGVPDKDSEFQKSKQTDYEKTIKFLQETPESTSDKEDDFKKRLLSFIHKPESSSFAEQQFEEKNAYPVKPSNSFTSNANVPNFESNVLNVQKFYNRNIEFDNLGENELQQSIEKYTNEVDKDGAITKSTPIPNLTKDSNDSQSSFGRISTENPPTWSYKSELPMNGGEMGGIVGFDSLESQYSLYQSGTMNMQSADSNNYKVLPHDDLRKPIVYEN